MRSRASLCALVAVAVVAVASCGSGSSKKSGPSSTPSSGGATATTRPAAIDSYCAGIRGASANINTASVDTAMAGLVKAAVFAQGAADAAPAEISAQQRRVSNEAVEVVKQLEKRSPATVDELQKALDEAKASVDVKYPSLQSDTDAIKKYAHDNCGMDTG